MPWGLIARINKKKRKLAIELNADFYNKIIQLYATYSIAAVAVAAHNFFADHIVSFTLFRFDGLPQPLTYCWSKSNRQIIVVRIYARVNRNTN